MLRQESVTFSPGDQPSDQIPGDFQVNEAISCDSVSASCAERNPAHLTRSLCKDHLSAAIFSVDNSKDCELLNNSHLDYCNNAPSNCPEDYRSIYHQSMTTSNQDTLETNSFDWVIDWNRAAEMLSVGDQSDKDCRHEYEPCPLHDCGTTEETISFTTSEVSSNTYLDEISEIWRHILIRQSKALLHSKESTKRLQERDRRMGLRACHSKTMMESEKTRLELLKMTGVIHENVRRRRRKRRRTNIPQEKQETDTSIQKYDGEDSIPSKFPPDSARAA